MMKKNICIIVFLALFSTACVPKDTLDPRKVEKDIYSTHIRDLSKKYDDKNSDIYDPEKSFDVYLTHFFETLDILIWDDCAEEIESRYKEFDLIYFKQDAKEQLKSYCEYSIQDLIDIGDKYANKTKYFDYNNLNSMYFYYNAYIKSTDEYLTLDGHYIPSVIEQSREIYKKFKKIRDQLSDDYRKISKNTPFDLYDSEGY